MNIGCAWPASRAPPFPDAHRRPPPPSPTPSRAADSRARTAGGSTPTLADSNCSTPGWPGFSPSCLGCHFNETEASFAQAVGRLWTSFAATGDPASRSVLHGPSQAHAALSAEEEWPRFGTGGRNVLLQPQPEYGASAVWQQRMRTEYALGREAFCEVWDAVDASQAA